MEQVAASSETIGMQAKELRKSVAFFKTVEMSDVKSGQIGEVTNDARWNIAATHQSKAQ